MAEGVVPGGCPFGEARCRIERSAEKDVTIGDANSAATVALCPALAFQLAASPLAC